MDFLFSLRLGTSDLWVLLLFAFVFMSCFPLDPSGPANVNFKQSKECSKVGESFTGYGDSALPKHLAKIAESSRGGEGKHHCCCDATAGAARGGGESATK